MGISNMIEEVKGMLHTHKNPDGSDATTGTTHHGHGHHHNTTAVDGTNTGLNTTSHKSNLLDKLDPATHTNTGPFDEKTNTTTHSTLGSNNYGTSGIGSGATQTTSGPDTTEPHSSKLMNMMDPRVDSGNNNNTMGSTGQQYTGTSRIGGDSTHTTTEPHSSKLMNMMDPRVDSGNNNNTMGSTGQQYTGTSRIGSDSTHTTTEPHSSKLMNMMDPRVDSNDSKNMGSSTYGSSSNSGIGGQQHNNASVLGSEYQSQYGSHGGQGPHGNSMLNKLDPRVNDKTGSSSIGNNHGLGGNTTTGLGDGYAGDGRSTY